MKEFRKDKDGFYICEECEKVLPHLHALSVHVRNIHNKVTYFNKWIREDKDGKCKMCKIQTKFISIGQGYKKCCCKKHTDEYSYQCRKEKLFIKYGVENQYQIEETKIKLKKTWLENYGVDNPSQSKEIKERKKETCLKNYGVEAGFADSEKRKITWNKKYGVDNPQQDKNIFEKGQKTRFEISKFNNTNLWYQGSYELDFLTKYYDKYLDIQRGSSIRYTYGGKNKIYHPDFYIPSSNLIIEIKNSYLAKKDKDKIDAKEKVIISNGFNYIMIIDQNYQIFEKLYEKTRI